MPTSQIDWGSIADWVSGVGSLSAAIVALVLARRSEQIRLRGSCGIRQVIAPGRPIREVISISATNVGTRATIVSHIGMRVGRFKKRLAVIFVDETPTSSGIPKQLTDGQSTSWNIDLDERQTWIKDLCKSFVKTESDIRTLRFFLQTNHGRRLVLRPDYTIQEALRKAQKSATP